MNTQLTDIIARRHRDELQRAGDRARVANAVRRKSPDEQLTASGQAAGRSPGGMTALEVEPAFGCE
jgi:hypothetical protein